MRHIAANALTLLILGLIGAAIAVSWGRGQYSVPGPLAEAICLKVDRGSNMQKVSERLVEQGAVRSGFVFRTGVNYSKRNNDLKAGAFIIPAGSSMEDITGIVTGGGQSTCGTEVNYRIGVTASRLQVRELDPNTGKFVERARFDPAVETPEAYGKAREDRDTRYRVAFAEGATSWQVVEALKAADFLDGEIASVPAEGSLAPNSYEVRVGDSRQAILDKMVAAQTEILEEAWLRRDPETPLKTREEALVLASIVEKETGVAEERPLVASVFVNRLNDGMMLQTDPTVIYGITKGQGILGRGLRRSELNRPTPYNTYVIKGLPPTPIANPGRAAIEAALNPEESEYIFFVADGTGGHAFAKTLTEHNRNVKAWRVIEADRKKNANN